MFEMMQHWRHSLKCYTNHDDGDDDDDNDDEEEEDDDDLLFTERKSETGASQFGSTLGCADYVRSVFFICQQTGSGKSNGGVCSLQHENQRECRRTASTHHQIPVRAAESFK